MTHYLATMETRLNMLEEWRIIHILEEENDKGRCAGWSSCHLANK